MLESWRRTFITSLMALLVLLGVSLSPLQAQTGDLPNFQTVSPSIYRGGAPTAEGLKQLQAKGVRTIIDLRYPTKPVKAEKALAEKMGFTWINLPMGSEAPTKKQVETLLTTLKKSTADKPVFVHCQHGADRTGCMIGIWRVTQQGWTFDKAWVEMRKYGFKPYYKELKQAVQKRAAR